MRSRGGSVTLQSFGAKGANVTSEARLQGWVSIVTSWGSRSGDPLRTQGQRLGGRKTDGDAAAGLGDDDGANSEKDPTRVDLRTAFEKG